MLRKKLRNREDSIFPATTKMLDVVSGGICEYLILVVISYTIQGFFFLEIVADKEAVNMTSAEIYPIVISIAGAFYLIGVGLICILSMSDAREEVFPIRVFLGKFFVGIFFLLNNLLNGTPEHFSRWKNGAIILFFIVKFCRMALSFMAVSFMEEKIEEEGEDCER